MNFIKYTSSLLAILLLSSIGLVSQSIDVERVITDDYPTMTAEFRVFDGSNTEVRNLNEGDFTVTENGEEVDISGMFCDDNTRFSLILVFDASQSMKFPVSDEPNAPSSETVVKNVAKRFIENLPDGQFEAAMMQFAGYPTTLVEFTEDKDELIGEINFALQNPTNYNGAFLGASNQPGAFYHAEKAKYKPFIIFLTDGAHSDNYGTFKDGEVISKANELNTTIYSISVGQEPVTAEKLKSISEGTNGEYYDENLSEEQLNDTYNEILRKAKGFGTPAPCSFEFETNCDGGDIEVTYNGFDPPVSDQHQYDIPSSVKPHLDIQAREFLELNPPVGQETTIDVVLTAQKNDLRIDGYNSTLTEFTVTDWGGTDPPFTITQGNSRTIKVAVNPSTRECLTDGELTFEGTACTGNLMNPKAGFIFAEDISFGPVNQGDSKSETKRFCNYTDSDIKITTIRVSGGPHEDDFSIPLQGNQTVGECECIEVEAKFEPTDQGDREAEYTVVTDRGNFKAKLLGGGSGLPSIAANYEPFKAVNCTEPTDTKVVVIENDGPVALEVSAVSLSDNTNFTYTGPQTFTVPANSTDNTTATVEFNPQSDGPHSTTMTIESNAENDQEYELNLNGEMIAIDYEVTDPVPFGELCATDTPISIEIELDNNNGFGYDVTASSDNTVFTTDQGSYSLSSNGNKTVTITFEATDNNTYNGTITFESKCGNKIVEVNVTGTINNPQVVDDSPPPFNAVVGDSYTDVINVENANAKDFDVVNAYVGDPTSNKTPIGEFTVTPSAFTIPGGGSFPVEITYTPNPNDPTEKNGILYLEVKVPCEDTLDNIIIDGNPSLAVAELDVSEGNTDYIGNSTTIPVTLKAGANFENSRTERITFDLEFNNTILSPLSGTQTSSNADIDVYRYEYTLTSQLSQSDPPVTIPLQFEVLNGLPLDNTDLSVVDTKAYNSSGEESAQLNTSDGDFTIILADGEVQIEDLSAEPGEEFTIPIFIFDEDEDLDEALHEELKVKLRYNFTVMSPLDLEPVIIGGDQAEIDITDKLKFPQAKKGNKVQAQLAFAEIPMRAKLGNQEISDIVVENVEVLSGGVAEFTKSSTKFTLEGVCKDGGKVRLYSPNNVEPGIILESQLVDQNTSLFYTVIENGNHSVKLFDISGNEVETIVDANHSQVGTFEEVIETGNIPSGTYTLIYRTPTQVFSLRLNVVK